MVRRSRRLCFGSLLVLSIVVASIALASFAGQALADPTGATPSPSPPPVRELIDQRTEYSQTWLLSDGSMQTKYFSSPVFVKDDAGIWQPVNPAFLAVGGGAYETASAPLDVTVASEAPGQAAVTVEVDGRAVRLDLVGCAEDGALVFGDTAVYSDVANATDVTYTATGDALRELITLQSTAAPNSFTYRLSHPGLVMAKDAAGEWALFAPGASEPTFVIGPLCVFDSAVEADGQGAFCEGATMTVVPGDGQSTITYSVPRSWLSDPARVWPVKIDPDLFSRNPTDVYLSSANPNTAEGSADPQNLFCGKVTSSNNCRTLIKFPQVNNISPGAKVNSAQLQVRQYSGPSSSYKPHVFYLNAPSSLWGENSTWNNTTLDSTEIAASNITAPNGDTSWMYVDCLDIVQKWVDLYPPNKGFQVRQTDAEGTGYGRKFRSAEYSDANYRPAITVNYTDPSLAVTSPGADSPVLQGAADSIAWSFPTQSQHGSFTVQVVSSGGTAYTVSSGILANGSASYSCAWNPTQAVSAGWTAKVTYYDAQGGSVLSASSSAFEIFAPPTVTSPNGGESWLRGSTQTITWSVPQSPPNGHFHVEYGTDGGAWYTIAGNLPATARSCSWTVLMTAGSGWKVRVECDDAADRLVASDKSDAGFTIADCSPTVTAPNGGGTSYVGRTENITWNAPAVSSGRFSVALVSAGGAATIVNDNVAATGVSSYSLPWTVGQGEAAGYGWKARVTYYNAAGTSIGADSSDAGFAILPDADPQHTTSDLDSWDGHTFAGELDTGKLTASVTDLAISSLGPAAEISRVYRAGDATTRFAPGWFFSFEQNLDLSHVGDSLNKLTYVDAANVRHDFYRPDAGSAWQAPNGFFAHLSQNADASWTLLFDDQHSLTFSSTGRLASETAANGLTTSYTWGTNALTVTAANGQTIGVVFLGAGAIQSATYATSAGTRTVSYSGSGSNWSVAYNAADTGANGTARTVAYTYASGLLTQVAQQGWPQSGSSASLTLAYNGSSKLTEVYYPDYDAQAKPDAKATITYDSATQATMKHYGTVAGTANQPMRQTTYTWDATTSANGGNPTVAGRTNTEAAATASGTATTTYTYEDDQQVESEKTVVAGATVSRSDAEIDADVVSGSHDVTSEATATETAAGGAPTDAERTDYVYDSLHRVTQQTTYRTYDPAHPELRANPTTTLYSYDGYGNVSETQVRDGGATGTLVSEVQRAYDASGRLTCEKQWVAGSTWTETDYSNFAANGEPQTTVAKNVQLSYGGATQDLTKSASYDAFGDLLSQTDWGGRTTESNTYDLAGRALTSTDAAGIVTHNSYDVLGNLTESYRTASGTSMKADWRVTAYDAMGRATTITTKLSDASGSPTTQSVVTSVYDGSGNQLSSHDTTVGGADEKWLYDVMGNATKHWALGVKDNADDPRATRTSYDAEGQATGVSEPGNTSLPGSAGSATTTYNEGGQVTARTSPDGSSTSYLYDDEGNQTTAESTVTGTLTSTYGADNRLASQTNERNFATGSTYDGLGRVTGAAGSGQGTTTTTYNDLGWVLRTDDAGGVTTLKSYDASGNVSGEAVGTQGTTVSEYDSTTGRLFRRTDPNGAKVTYTYDAFGNVARELHQASDNAVLKDLGGTGGATYDSLGRPLSRTEVVSGRSQSWTYPVNTAGGVQETLTYSAQTSTAVSRGARGLETSRETTIGASTKVTRTVADDGVARDAADRWVKATITATGGSAQLLERGFDNAGRVTSQSGAGLTAAGSYGYDATRGLKASQTLPLSIVAGSAYDNYAYADDGRLETWSVRATPTATPVPQATYSYSASGNLTGDTGTGTTYAYDSANRLTSSLRSGATTYYGWDAQNGWRTCQGPNANPTPANEPIVYTYVKSGASTSNGRMTRYQNSGTSTDASYAYDSSGQRNKSTVTIAGTTTTTTYDYEDLALISLSGVQGATSWRIDYLYDEEGVPYGGVYRSPSGGSNPTYFTMITNDHGDVLELLDSNGSPFASYRYDPWGAPLAAGTTTQATSLIGSALAGQIATRQILRYAAYAFDAESSLYYCSARYYDPATRQWTTGDPAKADGEESAYQYCAGEPVRNTDASGLMHDGGVIGAGHKWWYTRQAGYLRGNWVFSADFTANWWYNKNGTISNVIVNYAHNFSRCNILWSTSSFFGYDHQYTSRHSYRGTVYARATLHAGCHCGPATFNIKCGWSQVAVTLHIDRGSAWCTVYRSAWWIAR